MIQSMIEGSQIGDPERPAVAGLPRRRSGEEASAPVVGCLKRPFDEVPDALYGRALLGADRPRGRVAGGDLELELAGVDAAVREVALRPAQRLKIDKARRK